MNNLPNGCTERDVDGPIRTCECGAPLDDPDYDDVCRECEEKAEVEVAQ